MNSFYNLVEQIIDALREAEGFSQVRILPAFAALTKPHPLTRPMAAVGIRSVEGHPLGFGDYLGEQVSAQTPPDLYGKRLLAVVSLSLYLPMAAGGEGCFRLLSAVLDRLFLADLPFGVTAFSSGEMRYDRESAALLFPCEITVSLAGCHTIAHQTVDDFDVRSELI